MKADAVRQMFKSLFKNIEGENHEKFAARMAFCLLADWGLVPEIGYYRNALKEAETAEAELSMLDLMFVHVWDVLHLPLLGFFYFRLQRYYFFLNYTSVFSKLIW